MKKLVAGMVMSGLVLGAIQAQAATNVYSANVVGYSTFSIPPSNKFALVGVPFTDIAGTNATTLEALLGTNQLRSSSQIAFADKVLIWDAVGQAYSMFAIKSADKKFHNAFDATTWNWPATNPTVRPGDGIWIMTKREAETNSNTSVAMSGAVVGTSNSTIVIYPGFNLLSHQFTSDLDVNNSALTNSSVKGSSQIAFADKIYVWNPETQSYAIWAMKSSDRKWHYAMDINEWNLGPVTNKIPVGVGFWYYRMTTTNAFAWAETSGYYNNIRN